MPAPLKPRPLPPEILAEFADGILELRGIEVWKVRRRHGARKYRDTPHRIDHPTRHGQNRIVIRRGGKLFSASMPAILSTLQQNVKRETI